MRPAIWLVELKPVQLVGTAILGFISINASRGVVFLPHRFRVKNVYVVVDHCKYFHTLDLL